MSPTHNYKKIENKFFGKIGKFFKSFFLGIGGFFKALFQRGKQRFTVMLIPHSEKKIFNFQISIFSLIFIGVLLAVLMSMFVWLSTTYSGNSRMLAVQTENLEESEASLEVLREEIFELQEVVRLFQSSMDETLGVLGIEGTANSMNNNGTGDLSMFIGVEEGDNETLRELSELQSLRLYLESAVGPLSEIQSVLDAQEELLVDIPSLWPTRGWVSLYFGPAEDPFTGQWYLHKGIDITSGWYGSDIYATANGRVVDVGYQQYGYGNFVLVKHRYGFYTRYAHLQEVLVSKGDEVARGQTIASMGSTGRSTGPHLHYEVRIGSQIVDPIRYMNISDEVLNRSNRN
ncbi:MAG: M23 family metallopeptidase [Spirochaetia bacterium]